jgi:CBS-domain-containing membrane protein
MSSIESFLHSKLVRDLISLKPTQEIVYVNVKTQIKDAIKLLAHYNILSVPVRAEDGVDYIGWFSVLDALQFILKTYSEGEAVEDGAWSKWCQDIDKLTHRGLEFGQKPVELAMNKFWQAPVNATGSVYQLIESVFATEKGIHRIAVCNNENDTYVRSIVTQSDVIQLLYKNALEHSIFGDLAKAPIGHIQSLRKYSESDNLISMSLNAQTIHAFWLMNFDKVYGIPIVDSNGKLIANISASDIKGISTGRLPFSALLLPIREFIKTARLIPPAKCTWESTFFDVIQTLALFRLHRIWIVDAHDKPVGIITLTTLMKFIGDI